MLQEAAVLDRDDRLPHHLRDLLGRDDLPVLGEELGDQRAVAGDERRALLGRAVLHVTRLVLERLDAVARRQTEASGEGQQDSGDEDAGHGDGPDELHDAEQLSSSSSGHGVQPKAADWQDGHRRWRLSRTLLRSA